MTALGDDFDNELDRMRAIVLRLSRLDVDAAIRDHNFNAVYALVEEAKQLRRRHLTDPGVIR